MNEDAVLNSKIRVYCNQICPLCYEPIKEKEKSTIIIAWEKQYLCHTICIGVIK